MKRQALLIVAAVCCGQDKPAVQDKPAFDVASIKPNPGSPDGAISFNVAPSGRVTARNIDVWGLIRQAYRLRDSQIAGGPDWIRKRTFDLQAQPAAGTPTPVPNERAMAMLQTLLEERFHLKWHRESRPSKAYGLIVAEHGSKLHPATGEGPGRTSGRTRFGDLDTPSMTLESLCQILEFELGHPVVNRTGLSGPYAVKLQWASERARAAKNQTDDAALPSLFTAVQEQLGLKLESITAPVDIFVIDSVELPTEN